MQRVIAFAAAAAFIAGVHSQSTGPSDSKGASTKALGTIDLVGEIDSIEGRQLRGRMITVEPGGYLAMHTHSGRPTLELVMQGTVYEIRNGVPIEHGPGTVVKGMNGVTHWWENRGTVPVVLMPIDIFKP
jgi:quercetin dioxygenase-like cupin family protein